MGDIRTDIDIEGMSCDHCVRAVTKAIEKVPGVAAVEVTVGHAVVHSPTPVSRDALASAIAEEGYRIRGS